MTALLLGGLKAMPIPSLHGAILMVAVALSCEGVDGIRISYFGKGTSWPQ